MLPINTLDFSTTPIKAKAYWSQSAAEHHERPDADQLHVLIEQDTHVVFKIDHIYEMFPHLRERAIDLGRQLSGSEQEMLSITRTLLLNPRLLILDEPSQGLAPLIVKPEFYSSV